MADLFEIRIAKLDGTKVTLDVLNDFGRGVCDSESFALLCLDDCLLWAAIRVPGEWTDPKHLAEVQRLKARDDASALRKALPSRNTSNWYKSQEWMKENVRRFIASCKLVERRNDLPEGELENREKAILEKFGGALYTKQHHLWQPLRWRDCHNYTLEVVVTDPKWAEHLEVGLCFGTTAYDVWWEE
jgi:hypothetical protein